ncbi:GTPase family protein [Jeotgalibacillus haloalkalitolerans]|uniref:GTPase n=1 Tax=Jeotgalibacillus haloalkalitolerans TaxID=3104292 RepID=A0ABU5KKW1_9BACL|nr:GTPase [Jeotgalibacillus sp. HH7-29]MDZ5711376.1 GTPase [Jeotgalibacillus sp. HH7-29]
MSNSNDFNREEVNQLIQSIYKMLADSKFPGKVKDKIARELEVLKGFTIDARPARIAIVGRRGAGKSSLINAIFSERRAEIGDVKARTGAGKWHTYTSASGDLEILDTRGLGEGDTPEEAVSRETAIEEVKASIQEKCPDAILFLSKAKEVSARIDEDLQQLLELKTSIKMQHDFDVPIIGVVTQVDELSPKSSDKPPFDHPVKQKNIREAADVLSEKLKQAVAAPVNVLPVSSYMEFDGEEIVYDIRWNIDKLLDYMLDKLPNEAQMILAKLSKIKSVQKKIARRIGKSTAGVTGVIGGSPIPLADLPVITGLQMTMISAIAMIGGTKLNKKGVIDFLGALGLNVAAGFALRQAARQLLKVIPVAGNVISGAIATAGTYALAEAAIAYFIDGKSLDDVKETYDDVFEEEKEAK